MSSDAPLLHEYGVTLQSFSRGDVTIRYAAAGADSADAPLVVFLHGWPESWFSWRHQLRACAAAGWRALAPDMRGYGGSSAPADFQAYNVYNIAADVLALLQHVGRRACVLVGHDWGAWSTWHLALLHPAAFTAVACMSVPYGGADAPPMLASARAKFGHESERDSRFFYMLHHNLPEAAADYALDTREALFRIFCALGGPSAGAAGQSAPEVASRLLRPAAEATLKAEPNRPLHGPSAAAAVGMWRRLPRPRALPSWLPPDELAYFVREYERCGWEGGMNWYRVCDLNHAATRQLVGRRVQQPALFLAGADDGVLRPFGGAAGVEATLRAHCANLVKCVIYEGGGHWIQQERAEDVNAELLAFIERARPAAAARL